MNKFDQWFKAHAPWREWNKHGDFPEVAAQVWNAAIEAAAVKCVEHKNDDGCKYEECIAEDIRRLKA